MRTLARLLISASAPALVGAAFPFEFAVRRRARVDPDGRHGEPSAICTRLETIVDAPLPEDQTLCLPGPPTILMWIFSRRGGHRVLVRQADPARAEAAVHRAAQRPDPPRNALSLVDVGLVSDPAQLRRRVVVRVVGHAAGHEQPAANRAGVVDERFAGSGRLKGLDRSAIPDLRGPYALFSWVAGVAG